jgi:hypothetical protein
VTTIGLLADVPVYAVSLPAPAVLRAWDQACEALEGRLELLGDWVVLVLAVVIFAGARQLLIVAEPLLGV